MFKKIPLTFIYVLSIKKKKQETDKNTKFGPVRLFSG